MKIDTKVILEYSKNLHVLYVEDDVTLSESTTKIFTHYFKEVDTAYDGEEGLDKYILYKQEHDEYYDIVFTDINMPNMNGLSMGKAIKEQHPEQAIIFITASNEVQFLHDAINLGSDGFLIKPIEIDPLQLILLTIAQRVFEHKLVEQYYQEIEELSMQLQDQNRVLSIRNSELEKSLRMLDTMVSKEAIKDSQNLKEDSKDQYIVTNKELSDQLDHFEQDDMNELADICIDIDTSIITILTADGNDTVCTQNVPHIVENFVKFTSIISYYTVFDNLASALNSFTYSLQNNPLPERDEDRINIFTMLESFIFVLKKWQVKLQNKEFESVNFLDASLISDMNTIVMMYSSNDEVVEEIDFF